MQVVAAEGALRTIQLELGQIDGWAEQNTLNPRQRLMGMLELIAPLIADQEQANRRNRHDQTSEVGARGALHH